MSDFIHSAVDRIAEKASRLIVPDCWAKSRQLKRSLILSLASYIILLIGSTAVGAPMAEPELIGKRVIVQDNTGIITLDTFIEVLEDADANSDPMNSDQWSKDPGHHWLYVGQESTVWYRFGLTGGASDPQVLVLELPSRWLQGAHLFVYDHGRNQFRSVMGEAFGGSRPVAIGKLAFPLVVAPRAELDVYLRVQGIPLAKGGLRLLPERQFMLNEQTFNLEVGIIFGALGVLVVLSGMTSRWLRARQLVVLAVYGAAIGLHLINDIGYTQPGVAVGTNNWREYLSVLLKLLPLVGLIWWVAQNIEASISKRFVGGAMALLVVTLIAGFWSPLQLQYGIIPFYAPLLSALALSLLLWSKRYQFHTARERFFQGALVWLGVMSSVRILLVAREPSQAVLVESVAWLGHFALLSIACLVAYRSESLLRLRRRLRAIEADHKKELIEREALSQTMFDPLTGCPNRVAFLHTLEKAIEMEPDKQVCVCLVYLDRFKEINNTLGHHNGDQLLTRVARRLSGLATQLPGVINLDVQSEKLSPLAAIDGVVFGVLLQDISPDLLQISAEQILRSLGYPFEFKKFTLDISAYIGIASYPANGKGAAELLQHAYVAVELAQQRDESMLYYTHELDPYSARRLTLVGELKHALRSNELEVYYQPQLDIKQDIVIGVEALVRWCHPEHGFISPAEFIPVAEKTGVIKHLTTWVLERAIQDAAGWYERGILLRVSVNLSAKNLQESDLAAQVIELLHKYQLPTEAIALEITETAMMVDPARALRIITQLHDFGIRLCVDDFGTGYSSLAYLKQLPVAEIKIDRSFVGEMCRNTDDQIIVNTTLNMSHNLGLEVVAEGVEDEATLVSLRRLGCDLAQGYYIAKPMPIQEIDAWLSKSSHNVIRIDDESSGPERAVS